MTMNYTISEDIKISDLLISEIARMQDEVQNIRDLRKTKVKSLQKSVSIILNRLPYVIHDELTHHECKGRRFDD